MSSLTDFILNRVPILPNRNSSAADRDASKHVVEGDDFIQGRAAFREQFGEQGRQRSLRRKETLDGYVTRVTTRTFDKEQEEKGAKSHDVPTTVDGYVRKTPPPRMTRQRVGSSYSEWSEGGLEREKSGGGGKFGFFIFILTIVILIVRKVIS